MSVSTISTGPFSSSQTVELPEGTWMTVELPSGHHRPRPQATSWRTSAPRASCCARAAASSAWPRSTTRRACRRVARWIQWDFAKGSKEHLGNSYCRSIDSLCELGTSL